MIVTFPCPSSPQPTGGVTALYEFANGLARRGHEIHLCHAPFFLRRVDGPDDLAWFAFEDGIRHHFLDRAEALVEAAPEIPRADIVMGTNLPRELGLPVLLVQGFEMLEPWIEQVAFRAPSLRVCIAGWLVDVGRYFGVPADQMCVVHMGMDHDRFRPPSPIEGRDPIVAVLHHTHPAKAWPQGREVLERTRAKRPDLRAVVFGTTAPGETMPDWVEVVVDPDVDTLVRKVYGRSRVFLQSSHYEGFGFTAVEAMACGATLLTTDNGGSRDYAEDGETAVVVPRRDVDATVDALVSLLDDEPRRVRLGHAGEREVRRFDWDAGAAQLERRLLAYLADPEPYLVPPGPAPTVAGVSQGELAERVLAADRPVA